MSRILFLILSFLDFVSFVVRTPEESDASLQLKEMCGAIFFDKRGYPASVVQAGHLRAQHLKLIGSQHYKRLRRRIIIEFHSLSHFTLTTTQ